MPSYAEPHVVIGAHNLGRLTHATTLHQHTGPERLQRIENGPRNLRGAQMRLDVEAASTAQQMLYTDARAAKHALVLGRLKERGRLGQILVERVDAVPNAGVGDDPLAAGDIDVIAHKPACRTQREQRERRTTRRQLVALVTSEARENAKLNQKGAATRRACDIDFTNWHTATQIHRAVGHTGRRVKRRQQSLGQVDRQAQQGAVVVGKSDSGNIAGKQMR
jgi:hypothetical protein